MNLNILAGCRRNDRGRISETTITLLIVFVCALLVRFYHLNHYDLWFDELGTDTYTSQNLSRMTDASKVSHASVILDRMEYDPHSPLYYTVVYFYSILFGDGKSLRIMSVIFSLLSLGILYQLSRLLFDCRTSIYALLIMMFNPFHLWYAQEARTYAMSSFLALLVVYIYMQALQTNKRHYWIFFPIVGTLTLFSSYNSVLLLIATGAALFFRCYRRYTLKWIFSMLVIAMCLLLMQYILIAQLAFVNTSFWTQAPSPKVLLYTWMFYTLGYSATIFQYQLALPLFFVVFSYGVYSYFRLDKPKTIIILIFLLFPIFASYILSKFTTPIYIHRQLFIYSSFYYLFVAKGLTSIRNLKIQMVVVLCIGALMTASLANYYRGVLVHSPEVLLGVLEKKNYNDVMMQMVENFEEGDYVIATDLQAYAITHSYVARYFLNYNDVPFKTLSLVKSIKTLWPFERRYLGVNELAKGFYSNDQNGLYELSPFSNGKMSMKKINLKEENYNRIWVISSNWTRFRPPEMASKEVKDHVSDYFEFISSEEHDGVAVELYVRLEGIQPIIEVADEPESAINE